ncbi:hypothetical protein D3C80_1212460 [compost metagenome]
MQYILRLTAVFWSGLNHDFIHLSEADEVSGIIATQQGLQGIHRVVYRYIFLCRHIIIDMDHILREGGIEAGKDIGHLWCSLNGFYKCFGDL